MNTMSVMRRSVKLFYTLLTESPKNKREEEEQYQVGITLLNLCINGLGGVYLSKEISKSVKYACAVLHAIGFVFLLILGHVYYTWQLLSGSIQFDLFKVSFLAMQATALGMSLIVFPVFSWVHWTMIQEVYSFVSTFKTDFQNIHFELDSEIFLIKFNCITGDMRIEGLIKKSNVVLYAFSLYLCSIFLCLLYHMSPMVNYILFFRNDRPPDALDYNVFPPYYDHIQSFFIYFCTAVLYFLLTVPCAGSILCYIPFLVLLCRIMNDNVLDICEKMDIVSQNYVQVYETILMDGEMGSQKIAVMDQLFFAFEKDISTLKKEYEKCKRCTDLFYSFTRLSLSIIICLVYPVLLVLTTAVVAMNMNLYEICYCGCYYMVVVIGIFIVSQMGKIFNDMCESYRYSVYNLPWYYLPPKTRKLVSLLQSTVQNAMQFTVLGIYPVDMTLFPRMLNSAFSYANILRALNK